MQTAIPLDPAQPRLEVVDLPVALAQRAIMIVYFILLAPELVEHHCTHNPSE